MTGFLNPKSSECHSCFENDVFVYLGLGIIHRKATSVFSWGQLWGKVWSLGPQYRFGDKLLIVWVLCPHIWDCGAKRVKRGASIYSGRTTIIIVERLRWSISSINSRLALPVVYIRNVHFAMHTKFDQIHCLVCRSSLFANFFCRHTWTHTHSTHA